MQTIYTWGYTGTQPVALQRFMAQKKAVLLDIRLKAWSRVERWRPESLKALVGPANYMHLPDLGNANYKTGGPVRLAHPRRALLVVEAILPARSVVLLCACANVRTCHRAHAARYLGDALGAPVCLIPPPDMDTRPDTRPDIPVIDLPQPAASLVACGAQTIITPEYPTDYRGPTLIRAVPDPADEHDPARLIARCHAEPARSLLAHHGYTDPTDLTELPRAGILAGATLVDVQPIDMLCLPPEPECSLGYYAADRFAWFFRDARPLAMFSSEVAA